MTVGKTDVEELPDWTSKLYGITPEVTKVETTK
jgi:hypothetical protein